jgi:predicted DNA-binding helix-hairpin-helix protein
MDLNKIRALSDAGRFDLCSSCTTSEYRQKYTEDTLTQAALSGIYHAHITDGKTVPIFKTLMSNACTHDCNYCLNSSKCSKKQTKFMYAPAELARVFYHLYKNNQVEGLFLSSGIVKNADFTTERMLETIKIVRQQYKFKGYIHFKALPGVGYEHLKEAREYSHRISINLESTSKQRISELTSVKEYKSDILRRQAWIKKLQPEAGQTTQIVVGGAGETDLEVLRMMKWEYENMNLHRMYYSTFTPLKNTPFENKKEAPKWRGNRLYNIDWLYRVYKYNFSDLKEILVDEMLPDSDPKVLYAQRFLEGPVDVSMAEYEELIKVPGIGIKTAKKIIKNRNNSGKFRSRTTISREKLAEMGVVLRRADPFIKVNGWSQRRLGDF